MGQIITIVSGKGGAGKSTVANGIARSLTGLGYRVLLMDTDFGLCSAEFLLSGGDRVVYHLGDVAGGAVSLETAIVKQKGEPDFLAAAPEPVESSVVAELVQLACEQYDYVLLDRPAGLDFSLESHLSDCFALVVTGMDAMGVRGATAACSFLKQAGCRQCYVVLNRFRPLMVKLKNTPDIDTVCDTVGAQLLGIVPEDADLFAHQAKGMYHENAPYGKAFHRIACRLKGDSVPLPKLSKIMK